MTKTNIICLLLAVSLTACDFLHEESETKYTSQYIYETEGGLEMAVTALYALDRKFQDQNESSVSLSLRRATDLAVSTGGTGHFYGRYDPVYLRADASQPKDLWQGMYNIIGKCNDIIEAAEKLPESDRLNNLVAQAKAFRAQSYFLLYRTFDRIWLNTQSTTPENVNDKRDYRPATPEEVFSLLYSDLQFAINHLEWKPEDIGRFNQAAARHILTDVAMWNKDYQLALNEMDTIERFGTDYQLVDVDKIFQGADLNHSEALLVQQWSDKPGGNNESDGKPEGHHYAVFFTSSYNVEFGGEQYCSFENGGYGWGRCYPSPYLLSLYKDKKKDRRFNTFYVHKYRNTTDKTIRGVAPGEYLAKLSGGFTRHLYPSCTKFGDTWTRTPTEQRSYKDIIVYRLAETYLLAAEAAVRLGQDDLARRYYNKTWMRAGNDEFTGTVTLQDIYDEEAREMAFEGQRWYFLKRNGILIEQVKKYIGDPQVAGSDDGRKNLPKNPHFVRWPIPENEVINMGPENFPQNEGY